MQTWTKLPAALLAVGIGACTIDSNPDDDDVARTTAVDTTSAARTASAPTGDLRLEVDISARELHVYRGDRRTATHPVAVGSEEWPTPTGEWTIGQVVWNPRWVPPEESWAEDEEVAEPGDPDNPLGKAQLVYDAPNSIHGTTDTASLGRAESHGSIRVANDVVMDLARMVMEAGGAARDEAWYQRARDTNDERMEVAIPNPVPIRVIEGDSAAADTTSAGSQSGRT